MRAALLAALLLAGCGGRRQVLMRAEPFPPLRSIAVLPLENETVDLDGPPVVRRELAQGLGQRGYRVIPVDVVDLKLREKFGITDGGQLPSVDAKALAQELGVDALVYGSLQDFSFTNYGYYQKRKVSAHLRIVDAQTGQAVWEDEAAHSNKDLALRKKDAGWNLVEGVLERQLGKMTGAPLQPEARAMVRKALSTLPRAR